jgi:anhydro-N-acetylmuramic acid kinase
MYQQQTLGIMSGTSLDAIDVVWCGFDGDGIDLLGQLSFPLPADLKQQLWQLTRSGADEINQMLRCERALTRCYVVAVQGLLAKYGLQPSQVDAIGCHGQTIRHQTGSGEVFTLQLGDMSWLATHTGIACIGDFRRMDIALGGQGAPLMPAFHQAFLGVSDQARAVVNIGGIANVTFLPGAESDKSVLGFDTGPGNGLMDSWVQRHWQKNYDDGGELALRGKVHAGLLAACLADDYFTLSPPKSTGRDQFHLDWLQACYDVSSLALYDVLATLLQLTAESIIRSISDLPQAVSQLLVCGGGAYNAALMAALQKGLPDCEVTSVLRYGVAPQWLEAMGFAWLAHRRLLGLPGNLPSVTGAKKSSVLGAVYPVCV